MNKFITLSLTLLLIFNFTSCLPTNAQSPNPQAVYVCPPCGFDCHDLTFSEPGKCTVCGMKLINQKLMKNVAIFLYEGVEILDFSGPGEVFAAASSYTEVGGFNVYTVAATKDPITSQGFVKIMPTYSIEDCPKPNIIVLPGGNTGPSIDNPAVIKWVQEEMAEGDYRLSVCTGAFILEKAGLLAGKKATTWHGKIDQLKRLATNFEVLENTRWVDNGNVITTAGVSAGIDGALHLVEKIFGRKTAVATARYMEYDKWELEAGKIIANQSKNK